MPVTPLHFGPGLLLKAACPGLFSLSAFLCTQVAIDVETLYNLWVGRWPVHRFLHSLPGGLLVGVAAALILGLVARYGGAALRASPFAAAEFRWAALLAGGVLGGTSHSILDAIMHSDVRILYPLDVANPLHGSIGLLGLHLGCVFSGILGLGMLGVRWRAGRVG